jgi:hypothetical protein
MCYRGKIAITLLFFGVSAFQAFGQKGMLQNSIYFGSAKHVLTTESLNLLNSLADSIKNYATYKVFVKGNTDNIGDSLYNVKLSEQRVKATTEYLISKGIDAKLFATEAFGEEKPIANNLTEIGKAKNRRVDISISYIRKVPVDSSQFLPSIWELYSQTEIKPEIFIINNQRDTFLRCKKGSIVFVKAGSFHLPKSCREIVTLKIKEAFLKSEMILDNLSTTSNGQIIETQGMMYTEANDCKGNKVNLLKGKDLVLMIPTDTVNPEAKIFQGNRTPHDSIMNWTVNNTSVLRNFTIKRLDYCSDQILRCRNIPYDCGCKFFFCRINRLDDCVKGIFNKCKRFENRVFRINMRICKLEKRRYTFAYRIDKNHKKIEKLKLNYPQCYREVVEQNIEQLEPECKSLKELLDSFGVTNYRDLLYALNKSLMDSFGVRTLEALQDTMAKTNRRNIELSYLNQTLNFDDFKFYIYNTTQLGWGNVDIFAKISQKDLVTMSLNLKPQKNLDCKIIFKNRRIVLPAEQDNDQYQFQNLPKNEEVWVLVLKYLDGKPLMAMQETTIGNKTMDVEFKEYTLEELKKKLKVLDFR